MWSNLPNTFIVSFAFLYFSFKGFEFIFQIIVVVVVSHTGGGLGKGWTGGKKYNKVIDSVLCLEY